MGTRHLTPLALAAWVPFIHSAPQQPPQAIAITHVTVIDATGAAPSAGMTVVVAGSRIATVEAHARVPDGAEIIDGTGKFLIPGLSDMHVHLGTDASASGRLGRYVEAGITRIRDMASPLDDVVRLRDDILAGKLIGPQPVVAGPILQAPLPFQTPPMIRAVSTPEDARRAVDDLRERSVDFIKVGDTVDREVYVAIAAQAERRGLAVAGHLPVSVGATEASRAGQRSIEHFGSATFHGVLLACSDDEPALRRIAERALETARAGGAAPDATLLRAPFLTRLLDTYNPVKARALFEEFASNGTWHVPTLVALREVWEEQRPELNPQDIAAGDRLRRTYADMIRAMRAAGVKMLAGTDLQLTAERRPLQEELRLLVDAGLSPMEALQAATRNAAEYLGTDRTEGTVAPGQVANLVVLDDDPLRDIANITRIHAVVLNGRAVASPPLAREP